MTQTIQITDAPTHLAQVVAKLDGFKHTPQGVSVDFAQFVAGRLHYVSQDRAWVAWNGNCWDSANAQTCAESYWDEYVAKRAGDTRELQGEDLKAALARVITLTSVRARNEELALAAPKLAISRDAFDRDAKHLLVTPSGTVDLRTGALGPNDPTRLLTQCTSVPYVAGAPVPANFCELVRKLAGDDLETEAWLWRAIGYTLTGDVCEDAVFYLRGPGRNGKSTLIKALVTILGSYAAKLNIRVLTAGAQFHDTELANVKGARLIVSSEIEKGMRLREDTLKDLSGGELQTPRDIQQKAKDAARWEPTGKIWLYGNHDLVVKDTSDSIWARLHKIESTHRFPHSGLRDALAAQEGVAILSAAVSAAIEWYQTGLGAQPKRVKDATEAYRREQDTLGQFFDECLAFDDDPKTAKPRFMVGSTLRALYKLWAAEKGYDHPVGPKDFESRLRDRGCVAAHNDRVPGVTRLRGWRGVGSVDP